MMSQIRVERILNIFSRRLDQLSEKTIRDKNVVRGLLILLRFAIRECMERCNFSRSRLRYYERRRRILQKHGIRFVLLDPAIAEEKRVRDTALRCVRIWGDLAITLLDLWQKAGAGREELFNLCNSHRVADWAWVRSDLEKQGDSFSQLMFIYDLDYPDDGKVWIDRETDAPFTHAITEYYCDRIARTEDGKAAAQRAMEEVFPNLMEQCLAVAADEADRVALLDPDGVFTRYMKEE